MFKGYIMIWGNAQNKMGSEKQRKIICDPNFLKIGNEWIHSSKNGWVHTYMGKCIH